MNPLFGKERDDREYRVRISGYKRDWTLFGFSPAVSYVYTRYVSNIELFDYDRHQLQLGMTRQF